MNPHIYPIRTMYIYIYIRVSGFRERLMELPGRVGSLGRVPGVFSSSFFFASFSVSFFRRPCPRVSTGFDIKWDSPARKKGKDKKSAPKQKIWMGTSIPELGGPKGTQGRASWEAAARGEVDGSRQICAPREHTHSPKLLFQATSLDLIKYELSREHTHFNPHSLLSPNGGL